MKINFRHEKVLNAPLRVFKCKSKEKEDGN